MQNAIAWHLKKKARSEAEFAWITHKGTVYFASHLPNAAPITAVTQLVQYLFEEFVDHSFFILRERIWTTAKLTPLCEAMVKLAAKRVSGEVAPLEGKLMTKELENFEWKEIASPECGIIQSQFVERNDVELPAKIENSEQALLALEQLRNSVVRGQVRHDHNRDIAAILVSESGEVIDWATNSNFKNKTLHAEILLMQRYFMQHQKPLPANAIVYVSLKPCRMCGAMVSLMMPEGGRVYFVDDDPGSLAKKTELETRGMLFQLRI